MNLILLYESDFISEDKVHLTDHRAKHIQKVHRAEIGDQLKVGRLNQLMGSGIVLQSDTMNTTRTLMNRMKKENKNNV